MINFTSVISTTIDSLKRRIVKVRRKGKSDIQTALEAAPYGIDGNPIKDIIAIYAPGVQKGKTVIVGYLNKNQKAAPGEMRLFSTDTDGTEKFYIWLKADGTFEIGGNADNAVRYLKLNAALQQEVTKINTELGKISTAITSLGGAYAVAPISIDISAAKIDEIKTT